MGFNTKYKIILLCRRRKITMKKSLIAGAGVAALAMAFAPVTGVFAAAADPSNLVDTLKLTIADSCNWTRTLSSTDSDVTIDPSGGTAASSAASRTVVADQSYTGLAKSTIIAKCNNTKGYKITGTFTDLTGYTDNTKTTALSNAEKIAYGGNASLAAGTWIAKLGTATTGLASGTSGNVASTTASDNMTSGSTYEITYDVQTAAAQAAGYYEGTATYVFTQNS
ncbi:hypothetical protein IJJ05_02365 [Candidatus Saccharibacteria bacterium]|nr:hypothetical protein [Candidatus Saccharibacteria bacterium]